MTKRNEAALASGLDEVDWSVESTRRGGSTLKLGGRYAHSRYDPEREARQNAEHIADEVRQAGATHLIVVGGGLGLLVRAAARALEATKARTILVFEPFPDMQRSISALELPAVEPTRSSNDGRIRIEVVNDTAGFEKSLAAWRRSAARPHVTVHPGYEHVARFEARRIVERLRHHASTSPAVELSRVPISLRDVRVLRRLTFRPTVDSLAGTLRERTAIIASGGPSLEEAIPAIAAQPGGVVFACPQALARLHRAGIRAHYVVSPDPQDLFALSHAPETAPFDTLLLDTQSHPGLAKRYLERVTHFHLRAPGLTSVAWRAMNQSEIDEPFITVSETALHLARGMGARRFVLAGVDFDSEDARYRDRFRTRNLVGDTAWTNSHYFHAARYLDDACGRGASEGLEFFRVGQGLPIRGCRRVGPAELEQVLEQAPTYETPASEFRMWPERLDALRQLVGRLERERRSSTGNENATQTGTAHATSPDLAPLAHREVMQELASLREWLDVRIERFEVARREAERAMRARATDAERTDAERDERPERGARTPSARSVAPQ